MTRQEAIKELNSIMEYNYPYATIRDLSKDLFDSIVKELESHPSNIGGEKKQNIWRKYLVSNSPRDNTDKDTAELLKQVKIYEIRIDSVEGVIATIGIGDSGVRYTKRLDK